MKFSYVLFDKVKVHLMVNL